MSPQRYRDIRIAPIYEAPTASRRWASSARKLGLRGRAGVADLLAGIGATAGAAGDAGGELKLLGDQLAEANGMRSVTVMLSAVADDPDSALAGATPFLHLAGLVTGGLAAHRRGARCRRAARRRRRWAPRRFLEESS